VHGVGSMARSSAKPSAPPEADTNGASAAARVETIPVVVLNWNGLADTFACVDALLSQRGVAFRVVVVDNGSANHEADAIAQRYGDRVELLRNEQNLGFTGGVNLALRPLLDDAAVEFVALLNNDATPDPDWLAALVAAAREHPRAGLLQSRMVFAHAPHRVENVGIELLPSLDVLPRGRGEPSSDFERPTWVIGACAGAVLLRAEMLRTIGVLRDDFFANFEDVELSLRAFVCGYRSRYVPGAVVRHRLNASFERIRDPRTDARSMRNGVFAGFANLPWPLLLFDLPWIVLRDLCVLVLAPFTRRRGLASALVKSRWMLLRDWRLVRDARRRLRPLRRGGGRALWMAQLRTVLAMITRRRLVWTSMTGRQREV
jgi:GT2 family glycosyltransferase